MFAIGIRYLLGRVTAARWQGREEPEWPPHPDRVFMALVAAHGETGEAEAEAAALRWLEALPPPALWAAERYGRRTPVTAYVPVNDRPDPMHKGKPLVAMGTLPIGRIRQPRQFPTVVPEDPDVFLVWASQAVPAEHRATLEALCAKVTYLGHSSTPVQVWVEDQPREANLMPTDRAAGSRLRVFGRGRYDDLRARFHAGQRPLPSLWQGYAASGGPSTPRGACGVFDENLIVLRQTAGRRFALESTLLLGQALRNTLMTRAGKTPAPEWLGGHQAGGRPSQQDHLAILPLGFVGREHADGHLLGLALAVPRVLPDADMAELMRLLEAEPGYAYLLLHLGQRGECHLELDDRPETTRPFTLRPTTYTRPSTAWATVTPIVLDRFPRRQLASEAVVAQSCVKAGLPEPVAVRVNYAPALPGVPHSRSFPTLPPRPGRPLRPLIHAVVEFDRPILGPVMIGAGRYLGYGVCRPFDDPVCRADTPSLDASQGEEAT